MKHCLKILITVCLTVFITQSIDAALVTINQGWADYLLDTETKTGKLIKCHGDWFQINKEVQYKHGNEVAVYKIIEIGEHILSDAHTPIKTVEIPNYIQKIHKEAFWDATVLEKVIFEDGDHLEIDYDCADGLFKNSPVKYVYIGRQMPSNVRMKSGSIEEVHIGHKVSLMQEGLFFDCPSLKSVVIEDSEDILNCLIEPTEPSLDSSARYENRTFGPNSPVQSLYLGRNIECKGMGIGLFKYGVPFKNLSKLTKLQFGPKITELSPVISFVGCNSLTELSIPANIKSAWSGCFSGVPFQRVIFEDSDEEFINIAPGTLFGSHSTKYVYLGRYADIYLKDEFPEMTELIIAGPSNNIARVSKHEFLEKLSILSQDSIGYFGNNTNLKEILLGDGVRKIGYYSFDNCISLNKITLSKNLKEIDKSAFPGENSLATFTIPASVEKSPLYFGPNIKNIIIEDSNSTLEVTDNYGQSPVDSIYVGRNINYIPSRSKNSGLFQSELKSVEFAAGVSIIPKRAFMKLNFNDINLNIKWPKAISYIDEQAFDGCNADNIEIPTASELCIGESSFASTYIKNLDIHNAKKVECMPAAFSWSHINNIIMAENGGISRAGTGAFSRATELSSIAFADTVSEIGPNAFYKAENLQSITIKNAPDTIGEGAFNGTFIKDIVIESGLKVITDHAFCFIGSCSLTLGDNIKDIVLEGYSNFGRLEKLSVATPELWVKLSSYTYVPDSYGYYKENYTINGIPVLEYPFGDFVIADDVKMIGNTFNKCKYLTSLKLGANVESVSKALDGCTNLKELYLNKSLNRFDTQLNTASLIHVETEDLEGYSKINRNYSYNYSSSSILYPIVDCNGNLYHKNSLVKSFAFNPDDTEIIDGAFLNVKSLEKVELPSKIIKIGKRAFENTSLTDILLPEGLKEISTDAFYGCKFNDITLPMSLESLGADAICAPTMVLPKNLKYIKHTGWYWEGKDLNIYHTSSDTLTFYHIGMRNPITNHGGSFTLVKSFHVPHGTKEFFANHYDIPIERVFDDLPGDASVSGSGNNILLNWEVFCDSNCNLIPEEYTLTLYSGEKISDENLLYTRKYDSSANEITTLTKNGQKRNSPINRDGNRTIVLSDLIEGETYSFKLEGYNLNGQIILQHEQSFIATTTSGIGDVIDDDNHGLFSVVDGEVVAADSEEWFEVYNISGMKVCEGRGRSSRLERGIYIVRIAGKSVKVII